MTGTEMLPGTGQGFQPFLPGSSENYQLCFPPRTMADGTPEGGGVRFPFPFTPYSIQKDFMAALYQVLEAGKIGIFESPTGTVSPRSGGVRGLWGTPGTPCPRRPGGACAHAQTFLVCSWAW